MHYKALMKRPTSVLLVLLMAAVLGGCGKEDPGQSKVEAMIRDELGKPAGELKDSDFQSIEEFSHYPDSYNKRTEEEKIEDVALIGKMTSLKKLNLGVNKIKDISSLSGCTQLQELSLQDNQISDIKVVAGMTKLKKLELDKNVITDVSALAGLPDLEVISLMNNQITDPSPLAGLKKILHINLTGNPVSEDAVKKLQDTLGKDKVVFEKQDN